MQGACARHCACKRWVGGRSLHCLGPEKGTSTADSSQSPLPRSLYAQPSSPGLSGRALTPSRMQTSCALLSPSYPGSGRTDAGRRGGSRTQSPAAARTSMKAHHAAKPDSLASSVWSAGDPAPLAPARPDPSSAPPWATAPSAQPATLTELRSLRWPPADRYPRSARTRAGPHGPLSQLRPYSRPVPGTIGADTGNSTLPPARASGCLLRVPGRGSSGRSAASPEPTAQSPAPPREPPPGRPDQRVPVTVARRPLVPKGSQGEDPPVMAGGELEVGFFGHHGDHGTIEGQRRALPQPHTKHMGFFTHIQPHSERNT